MTAPTFRPMTSDERRIARAIEPGRVRYVPGCFHKRFALDLAARAQAEAPLITERQAAQLRRHAWTYRRQLPADVAALTPERPAGQPWEVTR